MSDLYGLVCAWYIKYFCLFVCLFGDGVFREAETLL
jgi:hypothetical protein